MSKTIDFSNKMGSDGIWLSELQEFKIKINYYFQFFFFFAIFTLPNSNKYLRRLVYLFIFLTAWLVIISSAHETIFILFIQVPKSYEGISSPVALIKKK